jgi:ribulose-phosphate 3-epimerase
VPPDQQRGLLAAAVAAGLGWAHWDATDGAFAVAGGFDPPAAQRLLSGLQLGSEAHLMMHDPLPAVTAWAEFCELVVVPVESAGWRDAFRRIETAGSRPALAVSPTTAIEAVPAGEFPVLVMSVQPGDAGADFRPATLERVRRLAGRGCHAMVGADGGVQPTHFAGLRAAGATWAVSGTALFAGRDLPGWIEAAQAALG